MKQKVIKDGYIIAIGENLLGEDITETEYNQILSIIRNAPYAEGKGYKLKTDLTWEEYDIEPIDEGSEEVTAEEIAQAIAEVFNDEE